MMLAHTLLFFLPFGLDLARADNPKPLTSYRISPTNIPYQVEGDNAGPRGPQAGYNLCNSTTENQDSKCQTAYVNDISDFCMWSSSIPNDTISQSEAYEVAWCTKPGHGTRLIPPGTIQSAQWLYAKNYVQVVGYLDQSKVNLRVDNDLGGGELDPDSFDGEGNPLGGLVFSNAYGQNSASFATQFSSKQSGSASNLTQVIHWIDFIGGGRFCLKMCNPSDPDGPNLCQHEYDLIGCDYNAIADYTAIKASNAFVVCDSDDMLDPGVYTTAGQVTTWHQPPNGAPVTTIPYTTSIPSSSNCKTYASSDLFVAATTAPPGTTPTGTNPGSTSPSTTGPTQSNTASTPKKTSSSDRPSIPHLKLQSILALSVLMTVIY